MEKGLKHYCISLVIRWSCLPKQPQKSRSLELLRKGDIARIQPVTLQLHGEDSSRAPEDPSGQHRSQDPIRQHIDDPLEKKNPSYQLRQSDKHSSPGSQWLNLPCSNNYIYKQSQRYMIPILLSFLSQVLWYLIITCIFFIILLTGSLLLLREYVQQKLKQKRRESDNSKKVVIGFFHPYCNAGGGGERVLWIAIRALQLKYPDIKCVVYTGDIDATGEEILDKARQRFNIELPKPVEFVYLHARKWVEAKKYPIFTLLGQSFGSVILGMEALFTYVPDIYIDSMGYAFTLPLFKFLGGCKVACYVHYPTISTNMLQRVSQREATYNNPSIVSNSSILTGVKIIYYRIFAYLYGVAGNRSDMIMVNSSWTYGHIKSLWKAPGKTVIVYPPCDISQFTQIPLTSRTDKPVKYILSVAQFRPEKDHPLQLKSFQTFLSRISEDKRSTYCLILVGGCRDSKDTERVESLKNLTQDLEIEPYVEFKLNVSFAELKDLMAESEIGLHTMLDEHFGIGVVELMAAGTIVLAHNSGGPKLDIVTPYNEKPTGFLAADVKSYADAMETIFNMSDEQKTEIRNCARQSAARFSESEFDQKFLSVMEPLLL